MKNDQIKLSSVGDIMLGDLPACFGFGVGTQMRKHGLSFPFLRVKASLRNSDLVFGNLEAVLSNYKKNKLWLPSLYLRGDPKAAYALKECGFKVVSVANNHMMQHGPNAFRDTINNLKAASIATVGRGDGNNFHSTPFITEVKQIKFGFLGYSLRPEEYSPGEILYCQSDNPKKIFADIHKLKKKVDFVILSLHWGDEFIQKPSYVQINMARALIDQGVDVILGHHPHVIQGVEKYKKGLIVYSLGNFIFDMWMTETKESMMINIYFTKRGIDNFEIIPLIINALHQPEILGGIEEKAFRLKFDKLCKDLKKHDYLKNKYKKELLACFIKYRKSVRWHYKKNITRYNLFYLFQLLSLIIFRRAFKKHI